MYTPAAFSVTDRDKLYDFIDEHSFGALVTTPSNEPFATHLPLLLERDAGPHGRLVAHVARANSQWETMAGQRALAIFSGPHAYISPTWYQAERVVPTWNYVAVHVYGVLRVEQDRERLKQIVRRTVDVYEAGMSSPWDLAKVDADFIDGLLGAIVGFSLEIDRIEGKWKLNQNHDRARRERVIRALRAKGGEDREQIARLMAETMKD